MLQVLVISRRFYPPWCDGAVVYTKGLVESLLSLKKLGQEIEVTILGLTDDLWFQKWTVAELEDFKKIDARVVSIDGVNNNPRNASLKFLASFKGNIKVAHITYSGLDQLSVRTALGLKSLNAWVLKHQYMTSSSSLKSSAANVALNFFCRFNFKSKTVYSSKYVKANYLQKREGCGSCGNLDIIPPAVDIHKCRRLKSDASTALNALRLPTVTDQDLAFVSQSDFRIVYFGPLIGERCRYDLILQSLSRLQKDGLPTASLLMVGRGFEDVKYLSEIRQYAAKLGLEKSVVMAAKPLTEYEKMSLLNYADVIFQPYPNFPKKMVIVDPPLTLLEAMAIEAKVLVSQVDRLLPLIEHGRNGFMFQNFEVESIEKALLEASNAGNSIGKNARLKIVEEFSLEATAKKIQVLYRDLGVM